MKNIFTFFALLLFSTAAFSQQPQIPIDFESASITYAFTDFAGGVASVADNPQPSGINTSSKVGQMVKFPGEVYGGSTLALAGPVDFGSNNAIKMKVLANRTGAGVTFKLEGPAPHEVTVPTTVANQWEELAFSFAGLTGNEYTAITIIYDLGTAGDGGPDFTLLFDDINFTTASGGVQIPINFESTTLNYVWSDFAGGVASVIDNPQPSGINTSSKVTQMVKFPGEVYGGSTLALGSPVNFGSNNAIKMKVFANRADAPVLFKLEGPAPVEVTARTTVANQWEELAFSFAGLTGGVYTGITIIYDLGVVGDGGPDFTLLFDEIEYTTASGGVQLPITFESTTLNYVWSDFAGGVASVVDNPVQSGINTSSKITQMVKFPGEVYGGSTLALGGPINFGNSTAFNMKTFANRAGASVLFKLEGPAPVELFATTTVANQWEELTFDATGLTGNIYTAITIIYELGTVGDGGPDFTLLLDDIKLEGTSAAVSLKELGVEYFPNPADGLMTVRAPNNIDAITVYNLMGQPVFFEKGANTASSIDLSALKPGAYFLKVASDGREGTARIIVQ